MTNPFSKSPLTEAQKAANRASRMQAYAESLAKRQAEQKRIAEERPDRMPSAAEVEAARAVWVWFGPGKYSPNQETDLFGNPYVLYYWNLDSRNACHLSQAARDLAEWEDNWYATHSAAPTAPTTSKKIVIGDDHLIYHADYPEMKVQALEHLTAIHHFDMVLSLATEDIDDLIALLNEAKRQLARHSSDSDSLIADRIAWWRRYRMTHNTRR